MRANKDEGKPEGHTLMKFAYPYFRDTGLVVSYNYSHIKTVVNYWADRYCKAVTAISI